MNSERLSPATEESSSGAERLRQERLAEKEAMHRAIEQSSDEELMSAMRHSHDQSKEYEYRDPAGLDQIFDEVLEELPERDVDRARSLFQKLAGSPHEGDRYTATIHVRNLTGADHDAGILLWDQLTRDHDESVRRAAYGHVETALRDEVFDFFNLTLEDALRLRHGYEQAEQGRNLHDPDRDSYSRFAELMDTEREAVLRDQDSSEN